MNIKNLRLQWPARKPRNLRRLTVVLTLILIVLFGPAVVLRLMPFPELTAFRAQEYSCRIYDRRGELIQVTALQGGGRREFTPLKEIPKSVQKSFIQQEDRRFYLHHGVDWLSLLRAASQNRKSNKIVRGGSTITMQLAKLINKDNSPTLKRKLKDIINAYRLEAKLSKKQILELYLNSIFFGSNSYGVTSAARTYYSRELSQLSENQIKALAVIPRNPNKLKPENPQYYNYPFKLPHFINYLVAQQKQNNSTLPHELHTTLDLEISQMAESFLRDALEQAQTSRITNGALLLLDNSNGSVLAWLGNGDFFDNENSGQIDGVLVKNQPGSSMKPFLYALAIENDLLQPGTVLADIPTEFGNEKLYIPENFNNRFNGPVRTRIALASSLNVPAVSTLNRLGVKTYLEKLYELGFDSLRENDAGLKADLGLALGAGEVSLKELVPAFSVFVRDGVYLPLTYIKNKEPENSNLTNGRQLYSTDTSRIISSILSDKGARALGFGYTQTFQTDYPSIFKTGTSNQYQNIIALGATSHFTIGVWMGNFSGNTVMGKTGSSLPAWVAKNVLDKLEGTAAPGTHTTQANAISAFPEPLHWHKERICSLSGLKAGPDCRAVVTEYVKDGTELASCSWHTKLPGSQEVTTIYPPEYQQWLRSRPDKGLIEYSQSPLTIITPKQNSLFFYSSLNQTQQAIPFEVTGGSETELTVFYDEKKFAAINRPFIFSLPVDRGEHNCRIVCGSEELTLSYTVR